MALQSFRELLSCANLREEEGDYKEAVKALRQAIDVVVNDLNETAELGSGISQHKGSSDVYSSDESVSVATHSDLQLNKLKHTSIKPSETEEDIDMGKLPKSNVKFSDIVGLEHPKAILTELLLDSKRFPNIVRSSKCAASCVLLYGPPGVGKSFLVRAIAGELGAVIYSLTPGMVLSKYHGVAEKYLMKVFRSARAEESAVIFFDEIDSFVSQRADNEHNVSVKNQLLTLLSGIESSSHIVVVGATNRPGSVDPAFLSRFQKKIYIPLPSKSERQLLLTKIFDSYDVVDSVWSKMSNFVSATDRFAGRDFESLDNDLRFGPLRLVKSMQAGEIILNYGVADTHKKTEDLSLAEAMSRIKAPKITVEMILRSIAAVTPAATKILIEEMERVHRTWSLEHNLEPDEDEEEYCCLQTCF